jgi:phosphoribosylformylglycinamidine synthase
VEGSRASWRTIPPLRAAKVPRSGRDDAVERKQRRYDVKAKVHITLKTGVLDPQGKAIQNALSHLGFDGVDEVRQGKYIEIKLAETDPAKARQRVSAMCEKLLANMIIENYSVEVEGEGALAAS